MLNLFFRCGRIRCEDKIIVFVVFFSSGIEVSVLFCCFLFELLLGLPNILLHLPLYVRVYVLTKSLLVEPVIEPRGDIDLINIIPRFDFWSFNVDPLLEFNRRLSM